MLVMRKLKDVSNIETLHNFPVRPFEQIKHLFHDDDHVVVTEIVRGAPIIIAKGRDGRIIVTNQKLGRSNVVIAEFSEEKFFTKFSRWLKGASAPRSVYWKAAHDSGIIGLLKNWPPLSQDIQIFGQIVLPWRAPFQVLIYRVVLGGKDTGFHSFLPNWVPFFHYGAYDEETIKGYASGLDTLLPGGRRRGIIVQHVKLKYDKQGLPIIAKLENMVGESSTTQVNSLGQGLATRPTSLS